MEAAGLLSRKARKDYEGTKSQAFDARTPPTRSRGRVPVTIELQVELELASR